jgi:hypothetical protein
MQKPINFQFARTASPLYTQLHGLGKTLRLPVPQHYDVLHDEINGRRA